MNIAASTNAFALLDPARAAVAAGVILDEYRVRQNGFHLATRVFRSQDDAVREDPEGEYSKRAVAFLAHVEEFASASRRSNRFVFDALEDLSPYPQRLNDIRGPEWLRDRPAQAWIYDRIGEGDAYYPRLFSDCTFGDVRPLFDPAYRIAAAVQTNPSIIDAAKVAAGLPLPVSDDEVERVLTDDGRVTGFRVSAETRQRLQQLRIGMSRTSWWYRDGEIALIRSLAAVGYDVDLTSTIDHESEGTTVSVPTGRTGIRVVNESLPPLSLHVCHAAAGVSADVSATIGSLEADDKSWYCTVQASIAGEDLQLRFSGRREWQGAIRRPNPANYFTKLDQNINEHRNLLPVVRLPDGTPHPDLQDIRSAWLEQIHAHVLPAIDARLVA